MFFLIKLYLSKQITLNSYFALSLALLSISIQAGRLFYYLDIININNPFQLEIDNVYDLKKYMNLYSLSSNSQNRKFFQNIQTIKIFIRQEHYLDQKDLIKCLFCSFGTLEIKSQSYQRTFIINSNQFQSVKIQEPVNAKLFQEGFRYQKILPSIAQFEIPANKISDFENIIQFFYQSNIFIKIINLDITFFIDKKNTKIKNYNQYVKVIQRTIIQFMIFTKHMSLEQIFNPKIIFYDIFE
ncbi:hypothetical protein TTHERM_000346912 (macronuclear) [Tetrahymena thermophila SB210]|uniref:Uncharacterized protein n=1 Tax=Tetrahymena thermophila (strain SB210) TaxID=312017 RepID=W7X3F3_TETTS|nr:hypothetical protein TTHERM_000346912 [Tetrahymena thermophila SB210]EWS73810.1 hypothetical protein TTHERM_000346912 [Tetrahymena thermophila SB210]|eukprot:XP_012653690.1 hypothetical protein TTHERM_000346912 [Tetrahymena thermophila SB210]